MTYSDKDMQWVAAELAPEKQFTSVYQQYSHRSVAEREVACLEAIVPHMMLPLEADDWFVGRRMYRLVGVSPSYWNDEVNELDNVGFFADIQRMADVRNRPGQTAENQADIDVLIDFWSNESTNARIRSRFTAEMERENPSPFWTKDSGVVFGLWRLAGAQLDYDKLIRRGFTGLKADVKARMAAEHDEKKLVFLASLIRMLDMLIGVLVQYEQMLEKLLPACTSEDKVRIEKILACVRALQVREPQCLMEAIQIVWLYSAISGTLDFGRMDVYFGDLYTKDIDSGHLTEKEAVELLLSFYRLTQQIHARDTRVILGGLGRRNPEAADRVAIAIMKASGIHHQLQPQLSLRMHKGMNPLVRDEAMKLLESGMTYPLLYNDEASIAAVEKMMKVDRSEAEAYAFFGCGEYVLDHRSMGTPNSIINMLKALEVTLHNGIDPVTGLQKGLALGRFEDFLNFEALYEAYEKQIEYHTRIAADHQKLAYEVINEQSSMLMMSLLSDDCIERGLAALDGGIRYLAGTYETYGTISTADSLLAIQKAVYEDKVFTPAKLLEMLDNNFEGYEKEQAYLRGLPKFGNAHPEADDMAHRVAAHISLYTAAQGERVGLASYLIVIINNSANTVLGRSTMASADGREAFTYMSNGNGPMAGMDKAGMTALLHSLASVDMSLTAGTAQNIKLNKDMFTKYRPQLDAMIDAAYDMGILSLSLSVLNRDELEDAMIHPDLYPNLFVRVGGFSARFTRLAKDVQQDVLKRTLY